ncbi:penicillin-binding protein 2 [Snodgrassella alvi]|uniref:Peptidoglycan D,D-transpeptidase MrdA n=1 Tax=Snodgrassella alvi TaxID=1196083 RepID=A0A2N9Y6Y4_9NEIS|nr:penicillin-binding protein 2 [Snodgrassella alvi]PIT64608.1 penicillin-binding protein 2 [Snodgrassella alvi]PIT64942.1 penicillin-binding protein 2 [Snodgrassella alvi]
MKALQFRTKKKRVSKPAQNGDLGLRIAVVFALIIICFSMLIARFVYLQVIKYDEYVIAATNNRISLIPTPPIRGEIVDVNGVVLAHNYPAYSLEITPNQIPGKLEDTINALRNYVDITSSDMKRFNKFRSEYRSYEKIPLKLKLTMEEASRLAAELYRFPGVEINARTFRDYPYGELLAHIVGYIGRISDRDMAALDKAELTTLYRGSTHIGKMGLEEYYERQLHGIPGYREVEKDAQGHIVRTIKTVPAVPGQTIRLGLDIRVQQEADRLMGDKRGALVAINPQTGAILAMVSKPSYNPNLFIDGIDTDTWKSLNEDWRHPLLNRATQGMYPPGSTFKPFLAMAALESGKLTQSTVLPAPGFWSIPGSTHQFRDAARGGHGSANLNKAIQVSSDTFFYRLGYEMGVDRMSPYLAEFNLGKQTGIDINHEYAGVLPTRAWKEKRFARSKPQARVWQPADSVSMAIGQGYNAYTPLQMAFATAILSNDGVVYRPHLVQALLDHNSKKMTLIDPQPVRTVPFKRGNFEYVKDAMQKVLKPGGTAAAVGSGLAYTMGGKTGTAQVVQIKQGARYNAAALKVQLRDHAWFIAFAPADKPQIAIAVILENNGWGATAAPLARQLADFYLLKLKNLPSAKEVANSADLPVNDLSNNAMMDAKQHNEHSQTDLPPLLRAYRPQPGL